MTSDSLERAELPRMCEVAIIARIVGRGKRRGTFQERDYILEPIVPAEAPVEEEMAEVKASKDVPASSARAGVRRSKLPAVRNDSGVEAE